MIRNTYHLKLVTPAFLGDAEQKGVWRTPPFKALIREWWRIAVAPDVGFDANKLRPLENALFGTAADDSRNGNQQSRIRLALEHWKDGSLTDWAKVNPPVHGKPGADPKVKHPEVAFSGGMIGSQLYLGYGPLILDKGNPSPKLKNHAALQAEETNILSLAFPDEHATTLSRAAILANWFGTVGGRSRNGWGSLAWTAHEVQSALPTLNVNAMRETGCMRPLAHCLELDWPHAIGSDSKGALVWQSSQAFDTWRDAMKFLAETKIGFRVHLGFIGGQPHREPQARHVLAYPVTNHKVPGWEGANKGRLANTLRFKVHTEPNGKLRALIYHSPCRPTLPHHGIDLLDTWQRVHRFLDANTKLTRLA